MLAIFLSGCKPTKTNSCKLLLDWFPNANHLPIIIGQKQGIFKKHGLEIELLSLQDPPSTISYLKAHQADVALYYFPSAIKAFKVYPEFAIIGKLFDEPLYCLYARDHLTLRNLSTKKLGIYGDLFSKAVINSLKEKKIGFSNILYSQCDLPHLFYFNQIDVGCGSFNVEALQLENKLGPLSILSWKDLSIPKHPEVVVIAANEYLKNNPLFAKAFQKALQESIAYCKEHRKEVTKAYFDVFPEKKSSQTWEELSCYKTIDLFTSSQIFDYREIKEFQTWFQKYTGCTFNYYNSDESILFRE